MAEFAAERRVAVEGGQFAEQLAGGGEQGGGPLEHRLVGEVLRPHGFADAVGADQDDIGGLLEEVEGHQGFQGGGREGDGQRRRELPRLAAQFQENPAERANLPREAYRNLQQGRAQPRGKTLKPRPHTLESPLLGLLNSAAHLRKARASMRSFDAKNLPEPDKTG